MEHDEGLCAALPVQIRSVSLVYCEHHQAYRLFVSHTRQAGDEPISLKSRNVDFGPFDSYDDVCAAFLDAAIGLC